MLAASAYTPAELDAQLTWIDKQVTGRPYGVDLLVPEKFAAGDPGDIVASLRAQIPDEHLAFVRDLLARYGIPEAPQAPDQSEALAGLSPDGAVALLDVAFSHPISLIANALGTPPPGLVTRAKAAGVVVAALVGQPKHAVRQLTAGVDLLIAQGTEAGGHTGTIATMVLTPEIVWLAGGPAGARRRRHRLRAADGRRARARRGGRLVRVGLAVQRGGRRQPGHQGQVPRRHQLGHAALADQDRQARPAAAHAPGTTSGSARTARAPLPMPLQPLLVSEAWQRIDAAAEAGHEGALRLESFFIGQVVGSFDAVAARRRDHPADRRRLRAAHRRTGRTAMTLDPRTPVIVGVGQSSERLDEPGYRRRSPVDLAADAARDGARRRAAGTGSDPAAVAAAIDTVAGVRQFENSTPGARAPLGRSDNYPRSVAARVGASPARAVLEVSGGQAPQHLVNEFAAAIAAGRAEVVAAVRLGGHLHHRALRQGRRGGTGRTSPSTPRAAWKTAATGCAASWSQAPGRARARPARPASTR